MIREKFWEFLHKLNIDFKDISIYVLAFIHRSIVNERSDFAPEHNERLEFLGDAVLELVITNNLYLEFWKKSEWELTDLRSAIVRWTNLSKIGLTFDEVPMMEGESGTVELPLTSFGGRFGKGLTTPHNEFEVDDGISHQVEGGLTLVIGYEMQGGNSCRLTAKVN